MSAIAAEEQLAAVPAGWTLAAAASIPESGGVALQAVVERAVVSDEERVAVVGAGGGVGCYAVQIATAAGAHVTGMCGTRMLDDVRALGASCASARRRRSQYCQSVRVPSVPISSTG